MPLEKTQSATEKEHMNSYQQSAHKVCNCSPCSRSVVLPFQTEAMAFCLLLRSSMVYSKLLSDLRYVPAGTIRLWRVVMLFWRLCKAKSGVANTWIIAQMR
jgi:hypothetical protein